MARAREKEENEDGGPRWVQTAWNKKVEDRSEERSWSVERKKDEGKGRREDEKEREGESLSGKKERSGSGQPAGSEAY